MSGEKSVYVCGPLTGLGEEEGGRLRSLYVVFADLCEELLGVRAFVPHEHYDPIANPDATPKEIDLAERQQVTERSWCLVTVADEASWGGGIEVEMANNAGIPVILMSRVGVKVSRLLRGNPSIFGWIVYTDEKNALQLLDAELWRVKNDISSKTSSEAW